MSQIKIKQIKELSGSTTANNGDYLAWNTTLGKFEPQSQPLDGEKGAQGAQGPQGDKGAQGPQGIQGDKGAQGPKGASYLNATLEGVDLVLENDELGPINVGRVYGNTGAQGPQGDKGAQGPQGIQGDKGAQGPQGIQGDKGAQGPQGIQGDKGAQGPQGIQGDKGAQGPQGIQGDKGAQGPKGASYLNATLEGLDLVLENDELGPINVGRVYGNTGDKGAQGPQGLTGPQGDKGAQGPQGLTGPQGDKGAQGPQGLTGPQGDKGAQGPKGASYLNATLEGLDLVLENDELGPINVGRVYGNTGAKGAQGAQGPQGLTGPQGDKGAQGAQGPQGAQGAKGAQGATGPQGPTGPKGASYTDARLEGVDLVLENDELGPINVGRVYGNTGDKGAQGPQGPQGLTGAKGSQGAKGAQGATGPQGPQGLTGATGPQGAKGDVGPGFTTIANTLNNRILTSDGTSNSANAESNFTFDGSNIYGNLAAGDWNFTEVIKWSDTNTGSQIQFTSLGNNGYPAQTAILIDDGAMVQDINMMEPIPMVWDAGASGIGYQVSSKRFKENIETLEVNQQSLFDNVRGVTYTGIGKDRVQVGFIAEDVEKYDPNLVIHDENGDPFTLDYGRIVPVLFEVVRELRAEIKELKEQKY